MAKKNAARQVEEENDETSGGEVEFNQGGGKKLIDYRGQEEDAGFQPIPKGTYNVEIDEAEYKVSASSGNPMWSWRLKVVDEGDFAGRILFYHVVFTEKMAGRNVKLFNRLGRHDLNENPFDPEDDSIVTSFLDVACKARVDIDPKPYEGQKRNRVRDLLPAGGEDTFLNDGDTTE
jgi:hypothetical protein